MRGELRGYGRRSSAGLHKRRCAVCCSLVFYVEAATVELELRNRADCDVRVRVKPGDPVCSRCVEHNPDASAKVRPLKVSRSKKACPRCRGAGRVRLVELVADGRRNFRKAPIVACRVCNGSGKVAA